MPRPRELSDARHVGRETVVTVGSCSRFVRADLGYRAGARRGSRVRADADHRRGRRLSGSRPHAAADRGRQEGEGGDGLRLDRRRGHAAGERRLPQEIRHRLPVLARELRAARAARRQRAPRRPLHGRRLRHGRRRARDAASREAPDRGQDAGRRRPRAACVPSARRMGGDAAQHLLGLLQHQPGEARRSAAKATRTCSTRAGRAGSRSKPPISTGSAPS